PECLSRCPTVVWLTTKPCWATSSARFTKLSPSTGEARPELPDSSAPPELRAPRAASVARRPAIFFLPLAGVVAPGPPPHRESIRRDHCDSCGPKAPWPQQRRRFRHGRTPALPLRPTAVVPARPSRSPAE